MDKLTTYPLLNNLQFDMHEKLGWAENLTRNLIQGAEDSRRLFRLAREM